MPGGAVLLLGLRDVLRLTGEIAAAQDIGASAYEEHTHTERERESRCLITVFVCLLF